MGRIILAEDDELAAQIVIDALMGQGHAVAHFDNGKGALAAVRFRAPHLLILDCNMPEMSGIEALRELRSDRDLCRVPVMMLTARADPADENIAMFEGANGYMRKPFDPDDLVVHAEALMAQPRHRMAAIAFDETGQRV